MQNNTPKSKKRYFISFAIELIDLPGLIRNLVHYHDLITSLTWRDFKARFRGTFGGIFWAVIQPLIMMAIYTLVFSTFLGVSFGNSNSTFNFAVYLLCGMLPWNAFAEGFGMCPNLIRGSPNLVKRVVFPLEVLPLNLVLVGAIQQLIGFFLLIPLAWLSAGKVQATVLFFPLVMVLQLMVSSGLYWLWASLAVFLPDIKQITPLLLMMWMFLTPIFYPESVVPPSLAVVLIINPFTRLITIYRQIFIDGYLPQINSFLITALMCLVVFMVGYFWFMRTKKGFADIL